MRPKKSVIALAAGSALVMLLGTGLIAQTVSTATVGGGGATSGAAGSGASQTAYVQVRSEGQACPDLPQNATAAQLSGAGYTTASPGGSSSAVPLDGTFASLYRVCVHNNGAGANIQLSLVTDQNTELDCTASPNEATAEANTSPPSDGNCGAGPGHSGELDEVMNVEVRACTGTEACTSLAASAKDYNAMASPSNITFLPAGGEYGFLLRANVDTTPTDLLHAAQSDNLTWDTVVGLAP